VADGHVFSTPPQAPYPDFPLRRHRNGQWYKSVWNTRSKKSEQFYFGTWHDDPEGQRALGDPVIGWLARRDAIRAGIDNVRVEALATNDFTLGQLMLRFLEFKRSKVSSGDLSLVTLDGYLKEVQRFVAFQKAATPAGALRPEHFSAFARHLIADRKLGRHARKRVLTYINTFLRYGSGNGWIQMPNTGSDWFVPATDRDSMRLAKARAGQIDFSDRIVTGKEIRALLARSQPAFKAIILIGINCGFGPADIGRLRWNMIDLQRGRVCFPRPKSGTMRRAYLWKRTRSALERVRSLKHNKEALAREGEQSLVFITRKNLPYYRESEVHRVVEIDGQRVKKLIGIKVDNAILRTFRRMTSELQLEGLTFYRLRHSFKTLGKKAKDKEALDLMMGHKVYDHKTSVGVGSSASRSSCGDSCGGNLGGRKIRHNRQRHRRVASSPPTIARQGRERRRYCSRLNLFEVIGREPIVPTARSQHRWLSPGPIR
jgi:integrase